MRLLASGPSGSGTPQLSLTGVQMMIDWMIVISRHDLNPFASHMSYRILVKQIRVGHFGRNQQAHAVRPIQETRDLPLFGACELR